MAGDGKLSVSEGATFAGDDTPFDRQDKIDRFFDNPNSISELFLAFFSRGTGP